MKRTVVGMVRITVRGKIRDMVRLAVKSTV